MLKANIFKVMIVMAMFTIGIGLILNSGNTANADGSDSNSALTAEQLQAIEIELAALHSGQWFGWEDSDNKTYDGLLVLDDQYSKPTQESLLVAAGIRQTEIDARTSRRNNLRTILAGIEERILDGSYTSQDLANYIRYLGDF